MVRVSVRMETTLGATRAATSAIEPSVKLAEFAVGAIINSDWCVVFEIIVEERPRAPPETRKGKDEKSNYEDLETDVGFFGLLVRRKRPEDSRGLRSLG